MSHNVAALVVQKFRLSRLSVLLILCGSLTAFALTAQTAYAGPDMCPAGTSRGEYVGESTRSYGSTGAWGKTLQQSLNLASEDYVDPFANTPNDFSFVSSAIEKGHWLPPLLQRGSIRTKP